MALYYIIKIIHPPFFEGLIDYYRVGSFIANKYYPRELIMKYHSSKTYNKYMQ